MIEIYKAQLVHKCPQTDKLNKLLATKSYIATEKIDGYWSQLVIDNNEVHFYSRVVSKKTGFYVDNIEKVPHIADWANRYLPNGTVLLGEVYVPHGTSKDVTRIIGSLAPKAIQRQEDEGYLNFWLHDILAWCGEDYVMNKVPYGKRYSNLCEYIDLNDDIPLPKFIQVAPCYDNYYIDLPKKAEEIIARGGEGLVLVDDCSIYKPGSRNMDMFKIKRHDTFDAICMKILPPTMEYSGKDTEHWNLWVERGEATKDGKYDWIRLPIGDNRYKDAKINPHIYKPVTADWYYRKPNAIVVGVYEDNIGGILRIANVSSGFTEEDKASLRDNHKNWIGCVVEIAAMSVDKEACSVRHPVFVRQRTDKPKEDCTFESVFG